MRRMIIVNICEMIVTIASINNLTRIEHWPWLWHIYYQNWDFHSEAKKFCHEHCLWFGKVYFQSLDVCDSANFLKNDQSNAFWVSKSLEWSPVLKYPQIQKIKKSKNLTNLDFTPDTCQKFEKMSILNSRYRGIVVVEMLILLSRYRGIVAIQGNYPQKCCHSAMSSLRIMLLAKPYPANTYFPFSWSGNKLESILALILWHIFLLHIS